MWKRTCFAVMSRRSQSARNSASPASVCVSFERFALLMNWSMWLSRSRCSSGRRTLSASSSPRSFCMSSCLVYLSYSVQFTNIFVAKLLSHGAWRACERQPSTCQRSSVAASSAPLAPAGALTAARTLHGLVESMPPIRDWLTRCLDGGGRERGQRHGEGLAPLRKGQQGAAMPAGARLSQCGSLDR